VGTGTARGVRPHDAGVRRGHSGAHPRRLAAGTVGKLSFELKVTPELLWTGLKWALAIGFIGGLFPAVRAARLPVTTALREL
jgi:putative ABC transport system permease protein